MKNKKNPRYIYKLVAVLAAFMLACTGCAAEASSSDSEAQAAQTSVTTEVAAEAASKAEMFTERDLSGEYDESEAAIISLNGTSATVSAGSNAASSLADSVTVDGSTITITQEGVYVVSGTLSDGMIIVEADDAAKVQIVLKDADITNSTSAALYVKSADKVFVTTAAGTTNTLANGGTFTAIDDNNIDGAVFAKDDITFNGSGTLTVTSPAGHGIVGKDDVKIAGGTINIDAAKHGVQANDSVRYAEATTTIKAGTDGIHVSDNSDAESGTASDSFFYIADGTLTISSGDDGIHADAEANIEGGNIKVNESYEGIEALAINVSGGDVNVTATDDGLNAAGGNSSTSSDTFGSDDWSGGKGGFPGGGGFSDGGTDGSIEISGGSMYIKAGGDGVDSNGSVLISGGYTVVCGPTQGDTSVLDYNSTGSVTGGTFIGTGGAGMASNFNSAENQGVITVSVGNQSAGTTVTLKDANGNTVAEVTPELDYAVVYVSTPDVQTGSTYTLTAGSYSETIELTEAVYGSNGGMNGGMQGGGPRRISGDQQSEFGNGFGGDQQNGEGQSEGFGRGHGPGRGQGFGGERGSAPDTDADTGATQMQGEGTQSV